MTARGGAETIAIVPTGEGLVSFDNSKGYTNLTLKISHHVSERIGTFPAFIGLLLLAGMLLQRLRMPISRSEPVAPAWRSRSPANPGVKPLGAVDPDHTAPLEPSDRGT